MQAQIITEEELADIRDRNTIRYEAMPADRCLLCRSFNGFADGRRREREGLVYYPAMRTRHGDHTHATHPAVRPGQAAADTLALKREYRRLWEASPAYREVIKAEQIALDDGNPGYPGPTMDSLRQAARSLIYVRGLIAQQQERAEA
jgi:hypothetical protein